MPRTTKQRRSLPCSFGGLVAVLVLAGLAGGCKQGPSSPGRGGPAVGDAEYVSALKVVNEFCQAWQQGNYLNARSLMSQRLLEGQPAEKLTDAIATAGNPAHSAYEIHEGRRLDDGRLAFAVRLYRSFEGKLQSRVESPLERVVLARGQDGQWRVDEFPLN